VVFPTRLLTLPLRRPLPAEAPRAIEPLPSPDPVTSLRQAVEALVRRGRGDLRDAADAAGQGVRSFQRSLRAAGVRFSDVLEEQRFLAARRLLADGDRKVIEVAAALGYSDSANFTRAFRRWAGLSPQAFRRAVAGARTAP
jgi:AraC-like DNA-binding protein